MLTENEIAQQVEDAAFQVRTRLGPGLFESVYQAVLIHELRKRGLSVVNGLPEENPLHP